MRSAYAAQSCPLQCRFRFERPPCAFLPLQSYLFSPLCSRYCAHFLSFFSLGTPPVTGRPTVFPFPFSLPLSTPFSLPGPPSSCFGAPRRRRCLFFRLDLVLVSESGLALFSRCGFLFIPFFSGYLLDAKYEGKFLCERVPFTGVAAPFFLFFPLFFFLSTSPFPLCC